MSLEGLRVVVLTHGTGREYEPLLDSLLGDGAEPGQILVVHNPSRRGEPAPEAPRGCEVLAAPYNLGYAVGMNRGIERQLERDPELLLVVTHDARFHPGSLRRLVDAAREHPEYGVLAPVQVLPGTGVPFSFGGLTRADGGLDHLPERPAADGEIAACDWVDGGTMLFRADLLRRIGGFDERFWIYCEDAEICLRATGAGAGVGVLLDAAADQSPGGGKRPAAWSYLSARNGAAYACRAKGRVALGRTLGRTLRGAAGELARAAARALRLRRGAAVEPWARAVGAVRGVLDFLRGRWGPPPSLPGGGDIQNVGE